MTLHDTWALPSQLACVQSYLFPVRKKQINHVFLRLLSTAAAAQQQQVHPEALQQRLLDQLRVCDEVVALSPEELLEELKALQLHALYGVEDFEAKPGHAKMMLGHGRTEQFLVEQVGRGGEGQGLGQLQEVCSNEDFEAKPGDAKMMLGHERTEHFLVEQAGRETGSTVGCAFL